jgi:hypothetical protein
VKLRSKLDVAPTELARFLRRPAIKISASYEAEHRLLNQVLITQGGSCGPPITFHQSLLTSHVSLLAFKVPSGNSVCHGLQRRISRLVIEKSLGLRDTTIWAMRDVVPGSRGFFRRNGSFPLVPGLKLEIGFAAELRGNLFRIASQ